MRRLVQWVNVWFGRREAHGCLTAAPRCPDWTDTERLEWRKFLSQPTGQKLMLRAHSLEYHNALKGCSDSITSTHSAGRACGFSEAVQWFESLSLPISGAGAVQPANDELSATGEPDLLEQLSP